MSLSKRQLKQIGNALWWILFLGLVALRVPNWVRAYRMEGTRVGTLQAFTPEGAPKQVFVPSSAGSGAKPTALLFWASWCGPCTIELGRFDRAVKSGEIAADRVIAISRDDNPAELARALRERNYAFTIAWDRDFAISKTLDVRLTPTLVLLNPDGRVEHYSEGLSLIGVWRATRFLR